MAESAQNTELSWPTGRQIAVIFVALMAAAMTTYYERMFQTSLADMQGIWGLSADEGAILKTCAIAPQMLLAPVAPWFVMVFGVRPVLLPAALAFIVISFGIPFLTGFVPLIAAHIAMGALLGCFITATIMIITTTLPGKWWLIPLGIHIFRFSVTTNTGVSLSGLYIDYFGWEWIYWQSTAIMVVYIVVLFMLIPGRQIMADMLKKADVLGMILLPLGMTMLFVAFDQGERLQWFHSSFVSAFLWGGAAILVLFVLHELKAPYPFAPLRPLADPAVALILIQICLFSVAFAGNQVLITQFLSKVHALKPWQSGQALLAMVGVQFFFIPFVIWLNRNVDFRLVVALGLFCMAGGCHQGMLITADWVAADFIPMGIFFAFGIPLMALTLLASGFAIFGGERAAGLVPYFQGIRVLMPYSIMALFTAFIRQRTDIHVSSLAEHITADNRAVQQFMDSFGGSANSALAALVDTVTTEAMPLAFQDAFSLCFLASIAGLLLLLIMKPAPYTPLTPVRVGTPVTA